MKSKIRSIVRPAVLIVFVSIANSSVYADGRVPLELFVTNKKDCRYIDMIRPQNSDMRKRSTVNWDGKCTNGYVTGFGTLQVIQPDGKTQIFKGNYLNGLEDGPFEMRQEHQGRTVQIQGIWRNGTPQTATIQITNPNGKKTVYKGELQDGQFSGQGEITYEDGTIYRGSFSENQANGFGKANLADGRVYEGEHSNGKPTGRGKWRYQDGTIYEGQNLNGVPNGQGKMTFSNGDVYDGDFDNGVRTGRGVYKWQSGRVYDGNFVGNKVEGYGKYTETNGDTAEGSTRAGKLDGIWIISRSNNQRYVNEYRDGALIKQSLLETGGEKRAQSEGPDPARRQKGMDHMYCVNYSQQMTANQRPAIAPGGGVASAASAILSGTIISMNRQDAYDDCMKNLGW